MANTPAIDAKSLCKSFGNFRALDQLSLSVNAGEVFGFLGPNGAGKTTTLRLLMGMLIADSGRAAIHGLDCQKDRVELARRVGYVPDVPAYHEYLTGWELVRFVGKMHGLGDALLLERSDALLRQLQIRDATDEYVANYSLGMKRKLGLVLALLHSPDVLILDEPTTGLDPEGGRQIQTLMRNYAESGRTVLLSTHLLDMADHLCDRVGIIHRGSLVAAGEPEALRGAAGCASSSSLEDVFFALTQSG